MKSLVAKIVYLIIIVSSFSSSGCVGARLTVPQVNLNDDGFINKKESFVKKVYYGTTRIDKCKEGDKICVNTDRYNTGNNNTGDKIKYGYVNVMIPYLKKIGSTDGMNIVQISSDLGWNKFKSEISSNDMLIYIHGFNTSFNEAAVRCAQLSYDLNYHGVPIFFSWPSGNSGPTGYAKDKKRAEENKSFLAEFLTKVAGTTDKKIHIVAHSMGGYILINSLVEIEQMITKDRSMLSARKSINRGNIFNQIVFAASDVEKNKFSELFRLNSLETLASGYTLYSTHDDYPLITSRYINYFIEDSGVPRLGDSSGSFAVIKGIDTIDGRLEVSPQVIGHSYYAEDKGFVTDLFLLFNYEIKPEHRMLINVRDKADRQLWFLRP